MTDFAAVEVRDVRQMRPPLEAELHEQLDTGLIVGQQNSDQRLEAQGGAALDRTRDQLGRDTLPVVRHVDVITDLGRMTKCAATGTIAAEARPANHGVVHRGDEYRVIRGMTLKPLSLVVF